MEQIYNYSKTTLVRVNGYRGEMNRVWFGLLALLGSATFALAACSGATMATLPAMTPGLAETPIALPTNTAPAATPTVAPLPTNAPTGTATPGTAFLKIPSLNCCRGQSLAVGVYEVPAWLDIPLTVEVGEGWRGLNEKAALLFLIGRGRNVQNNPSQLIVFLNVTNRTTPEGLIDSVLRAPELTAITEPVTVTVAGFAGLQLDSIAKPNPKYEGSPQEDIPPGVQFLPVFMKFFTPGFAWTTSSSEAQIRTVVLTVGDQTLLLYVEAPPDEFDQFAADADSILQSLALIKQ